MHADLCQGLINDSGYDKQGDRSRSKGWLRNERRSLERCVQLYKLIIFCSNYNNICCLIGNPTKLEGGALLSMQKLGTLINANDDQSQTMDGP